MKWILIVLAIALAITPAPAQIMTTPFLPPTTTIGVAAGYRIARGTIALDAANPTTVATGLTTVVSCTSDLVRNTALSAGTAFVTHAVAVGANVDFYAWLLTGAASTGTESFEWVCVGT